MASGWGTLFWPSHCTWWNWSAGTEGMERYSLYVHSATWKPWVWCAADLLPTIHPHSPGETPMNQNLQGSGLHHMTILVHGCRLLLETCRVTEKSSLLESGLWIEPCTGSRSFQKYPEISRCWVIAGFCGNWSHFLTDCLFNPTWKLLSACFVTRGN